MSCESSCPTSGMAHTPEAMTYQLLMSAMKAKKSLMHDKLKAKLDTKIGDKLDQAAEATVDTFIAIWQDKSSTMEHKAKLTEKLATMMQDK